MEIKPLYDKNHYDIFLGTGWENWVRVKIIPKDRAVETLNYSPTVDVTPKLLELIFWKVKAFERKQHNAVYSNAG